MKLPNKLSSWIKIALDCEARANNLAGYVVDLEYFHDYDEKIKKCRVCLAGCTAALLLGLPRNETTYMFKLPDPERKYIRALEQINRGYIKYALDELGVAKPNKMLSSLDMADYNTNRNGWRRDVREIQNILTEFGL